MIYLSIIEDDKNIARKYLNMAFSVSLMFFLAVFIVSKMRPVSHYFYLLPGVAFVFCYTLSVFYKKRGKVNSVVVNDVKVEFVVNDAINVFNLYDIVKISVTIIKSSQEHYYDFYLHTSDGYFLAPRLESVTDVEIIKLLISLNRKIDISEIEKNI